MRGQPGVHGAGELLVSGQFEHVAQSLPQGGLILSLKGLPKLRHGYSGHKRQQGFHGTIKATDARGVAD